jgi:hypothetical protein
MEPPVERSAADAPSKSTDLVAACTFALVGTTLLLAPASLHAATILDIEHPFPVDSDIAFYCAGALVVLAPTLAMVESATT